MFIQILQNVGLALIAILLFTLIKSRGAISEGEFQWDIFWSENRNRWIWTMVVVLCIAIVNTCFPESLNAITSLAGIQLGEGAGAFATLAVLLLSTAKGGVSTKKRKSKLELREKKMSN